MEAREIGASEKGLPRIEENKPPESDKAKHPKPARHDRDQARSA
jgi:hypothetical protein